MLALVPSIHLDSHFSVDNTLTNHPNQDSIHNQNKADFVSLWSAPKSSTCLVLINTTIDKARESLVLACTIAKHQEFEPVHLRVDFAR